MKTIPAIRRQNASEAAPAADSAGPRFWRSLGEQAGTEEFLEKSAREFAPLAPEWPEDLSRRRFLQILGGTLGLAGLAACTKQPLETIVPYVTEPEEVIPGRPLWYATALTLGGYATGVLVESHEGRPTKIEGNPGHPASLGATNAFCQAAILDLYDPDRSKSVENAGYPSTWEMFLEEMDRIMAAQEAGRGAGLRLLTEPVSSPSLAARISALLARYPEARCVEYDPLGRDPVLEGARLAFGEAVEAVYHFDQAEVIVGFDPDFLSTHPFALSHARAFARGRRGGAEGGLMNRFYAIESTPGLTGVNADERVPASPAELAAAARALGLATGVPGIIAEAIPEALQHWAAAAARDVKAHRGRGLVLAGAAQPAEIHALAHRMNDALGNNGSTVTYISPRGTPGSAGIAALRALSDEMEAGKVELLVILGGNPVFDAPADLDFGERMKKAGTAVQWAPAANETTDRCRWHIPAAHFLETWSDARAFDGTASIVQPLILPLYDGKSAYEMLDALERRPVRRPYDVVREYWSGQGIDLNAGWRRALNDGIIPGTAYPAKQVSIRPEAAISAGKPTDDEKGLAVIFRPDPSVWDGRFANNGWLQELPRPLTKIVWDNAVLVSPQFAGIRGLKNGDIVSVQAGARRLEGPVQIQPGQAANCLTIHLGNGRERCGSVGKGVGFNAYPLRTSDAPWEIGGVTIAATGKRQNLVDTQEQHSIEGRNLFRAGSLEEFKADRDFARKEGEDPDHAETLYHPDEFQQTGYAWGMVIDLSSCIGCLACMIACQSENNIPVVGKEQARVGRTMHWIRVDAWFDGPPENPGIAHQPVTCMHCENAPCELVCPVGATLHDKEGLNVQVYNRCIGTRYCSNNCPYKVRRFNFLQYSDNRTESYKLMRNPNVTVRSRGVMEKCTYCIQRINAARITAELAGRRITDGEVIPACAQACPAEAIVFGDIHDPKSRVSALKAGPLNFGMLAERNTRPRTTYLAKLRNPKPAGETE